MKYLLRGDDDRSMGVEQIEAPSFRAICHFCSWRGPEQHYDEDALSDLERHAESGRHRQNVISELVAERTGFESRFISGDKRP